ncbi:iron chelate uptake ABC transporter family permease subunit [Actinocorallia sp. API 0066]|uniref:FecCD family ABC transporter permease n=1 Tax=Actinocorallia sp. API 0066 TaxID=2896846 RepID=UPI001E43B7AB|nr:iron chelate uptake ABC transporter family permease subunit [Actinocorallia sp. API 0066]MCD0449185.1 iron chelate uptake ABC transporter family permease subunit [Actinocorallia sp. API 0066]
MPILPQTRFGPLALGLLALAAALVAAAALSLAVGANALPPHTVWEALTQYDPANPHHLVVVEKRLPRTLVGVTAGLGLAVAGVVMQGLTRNPLADPGLLSVNSGASLSVVVAISVFGVQGGGRVWFAFAGAALVTVLVYGIASVAGRGGASPVTLVLAGAAVSAALTSIVTAILLTDRAAFDQMRFWQVGGLAARDFAVLWQTLPGIAAGFVIAFGISRGLNGLAMGEEVARGLGQRVGLVRALAALTVVLLCGSATAAAGPISFAGLIVAHVAARLAGPDHRWTIPYAALAGPTLLLACDVLGRVVVRPGELQVGVVVAAVGAPLLVVLVRLRERGRR